jgi:hypothetical protein
MPFPELLSVTVNVTRSVSVDRTLNAGFGSELAEILNCNHVVETQYFDRQRAGCHGQK